MSSYSATIRKIKGIGEVSVTVELLPHTEFHMRFDPSSPTEVTTPDGNAIEAGPMCLSGARYARHLFPLNNSRIMIKAAKGTLESQDDNDALCIVTILAIGKALQKEELIPEQTFIGHGGSWEKVLE